MFRRTAALVASTLVGCASTYAQENPAPGINRWGIRGDHRFLIIKSNTDAGSFFGTETRDAHRLFPGFIVNAAR